MANRQLSEKEVEELFRPLFEKISILIREKCHGDEELHWALRRKIAKELTYAERGKPASRSALKRFKIKEQHGKCAICNKLLPKENVVLDRYEAMKGYTKENTRVICKECDYKVQKRRGFK